MSGRLYGLGVGPGDPELLTVKAVRILAQADVIAHFAKAGRNGNAYATVESHLRPGVILEPLHYPVTTEVDKDLPAYKEPITAFYEEAAGRIARHLDAGRTVAILSEGDPMFYGSYMHLHVRFAGRYEVEVVPGVTGMSGGWSALGAPIAQGDDILSILPGTLPEAALVEQFRNADAMVVMKVGRNLPKIRRALIAAGREAGAFYVERATMANQTIMPLADKSDDVAPYFSIVLIPGWQARP
ncbi:precorrin-2 C(20)-methyltransferase [Lacibacterium aquatile]|uniref:Precorrin-2 C(20)-methyltransferase n=1 Tax=Lacibacterium aquatile TaxID=1168082 RepID=A0ABW5DVB4_9PROT